MNLNISPDTIKRVIVTFLHRFHIMIFAVIVLCSLIVMVYLLYNIVVKSTDESNIPTDNTNTSFDQETIKRINELKSRDQSGGSLDFSQGRTNPFVE